MYLCKSEWNINYVKAFNILINLCDQKSISMNDIAIVKNDDDQPFIMKAIMRNTPLKYTKHCR